MSRFIDHNTFSALPVEGTPEQEVKVKKRRDRKHVHQHTKSNNSAASLQNNKTNAHIDASKTLAEHSLARPYSLKAKKITEQTKLKSESPGELPVKLKRQVTGQYKVVAPGTPYNEVHLSDYKEKLENFVTKPAPKGKTSWRSWAFGRKFFFPAGILLGLLFSAYRFAPGNMPPEVMEALYGEAGGLRNMKDWLPDVSSFPSLNFENWASEGSLVDQTRKAFLSREFTAAEDLIREVPDIKQNFPVILIPGIVSTGLEQWSASGVAKGSFRKRLWSTTQMVSAVLADRKKWMESLAIDPVTGLDPVGYKVRAAQGLDAASEFIQGYWVWQRVIENLAAIGYDTNMLELASYDWRLSYYNLEIRDAYFSRLRDRIEQFKRLTGKKTVLVSHSMGGTVVLFFLKWVEAMPEDDFQGQGFGGGGGPDWCETYLESHVGIASTYLGVPKSMTAFLSGEMKDTVEIHPAGSWVLEKFFSRRERAELFRKWPGSASMWIKGGDRIWGNLSHAHDDPANCTDTHGRFFSFRQTSDSGPNSSHQPKGKNLDSEQVQPNMTSTGAGAYTLIHTPQEFQKMYASNYSNGFESNLTILQNNAKDHRKWTNPLEVQLPQAPSMKQYCMYGWGKETERSYWYMQGQYEHDEIITEGDGAQCTPDELHQAANGTSITCRTPLDMPMARKNWIDTEVTIDGSIPEVRRGVKFGEGDGTVPLLSLGAMCVKGWKDDRWNPARMPVITHEFKHEPEGIDLRGGAKTADHIDLLGNTALNQAVLKIASGTGQLEDHIVSNIKEYAESIDWD